MVLSIDQIIRAKANEPGQQVGLCPGRKLQNIDHTGQGGVKTQKPQKTAPKQTHSSWSQYQARETRKNRTRGPRTRVMFSLSFGQAQPPLVPSTIASTSKAVAGHRVNWWSFFLIKQFPIPWDNFFFFPIYSFLWCTIYNLVGCERTRVVVRLTKEWYKQAAEVHLYVLHFSVQGCLSVIFSRFTQSCGYNIVQWAKRPQLIV